MKSTGDLMAERVSGHVSWLAAMVRKSMRLSKEAMAAAHEVVEEFDLPSRRDSMSATTLSRPAMWQMSLVCSAI